MAEIDKKDKIIRLEDFAEHMKQFALAIDGQTDEKASNLALLIVKAIEELESKFVDKTNNQDISGRKNFDNIVTFYNTGIVGKLDEKTPMYLVGDNEVSVESIKGPISLSPATEVRVLEDKPIIFTTQPETTDPARIGSQTRKYEDYHIQDLIALATGQFILGAREGLSIGGPDNVGLPGQALVSNGPDESPEWKYISGGDTPQSIYTYTCTGTDKDLSNIVSIIESNHGIGSFTLQIEGNLVKSKNANYMYFGIPEKSHVTLDFSRANITCQSYPLFVVKTMPWYSSLRVTGINYVTNAPIYDLFGIGEMGRYSSFTLDNCTIISTQGNNGAAVMQLSGSSEGFININNCVIHCGDTIIDPDEEGVIKTNSTKLFDEFVGANLMMTNNKIWCSAKDSIRYYGVLVCNNNIISSNDIYHLFRRLGDGTYIDPTLTNYCIGFE